MTGVIILDTLKVFEQDNSGSISFIFGIISTCIGFWVLFYTLNKMSQPNFKLSRGIVFATLAGLLVAAGVVLSFSDGDGYEKTQYQVLLTEDVNIAEFREKYEIVGEQGITYIVEERSNQEENVNE